MNIRYLIIFLVSVFTIISCQREVDDIPDRPTNTNSNDSIYLKQYVEIDTTATPGLDSIYKYEFYYDNAKRITGYLHTQYINNLNEKVLTNVKYYYNGSDTVPFKTTQHTKDGAFSYLDTTFYTFINGKVSSDSVIFYRENNHELLYTSKTDFSASGQNVILKSRYVTYLLGVPTVTIDSCLVSITMTGSNISTQSVPPGFLFWDYSKFTYDNLANPFYRIDIHYPIAGYSFFEAERNNCLSQQNGTDPSSLSSHYIVTYTYRADGYPLMLKESDLFDPAYTAKGFFYYTK